MNQQKPEDLGLGGLTWRVTISTVYVKIARCWFLLLFAIVVTDLSWVPEV